MDVRWHYWSQSEQDGNRIRIVRYDVDKPYCIASIDTRSCPNPEEAADMIVDALTDRLHRENAKLREIIPLERLHKYV